MSVLTWIERWALKRAGRREDEKLLQLEKVHQEIVDGQLNAEVVFSGPAAKVFAAFAIDWFKKTGGNNFITCEITDSSDGTGYELTMRKRWAKSPAMEIGELRAENARLRHDLTEAMSNHVADLNP
jgi:hypothetical protein